MNTTHLTAASGLALALALSGTTALAEQDKQQQDKQAQQAQQSTKQQNTNTASSTGKTSQGKSGSANDKMATFDTDEIEGIEVIDRNGNDIGEVDDLVRGEDGKSYAVISIGGFFDVGDKDIAVPLEKLSKHGDAVMLPNDMSSVDQLQNQEEFNEDLYTQIEDKDQIQLQRAAFGASGKGSGKQMTVDASEISGAQVVDRNGNDIGEVDDVVRGEDGKHYAVISVGGFFDIGDKDVALPLDRLSMWRESVVVPQDLNSIDQLQNREAYNEDLYTQVEDQDQIQIERSDFAAMETGDDTGGRDGIDQDKKAGKTGSADHGKSQDKSSDR